MVTQSAFYPSSHDSNPLTTPPGTATAVNCLVKAPAMVLAPESGDPPNEMEMFGGWEALLPDSLRSKAQ